MRGIVRAALVLFCVLVWAGPAAAQSAPDPDLVRGLHTLKQIEQGIADLKQGDVAAYNALTQKLAQARKSLETTKSTQHPDYASAVDRWSKARAKLVEIAEAWRKSDAGAAATDSGGGGAPSPPAAQPAEPAAEPEEPAADNGLVALNEELIAAFEELKKIQVDAFADEPFYLQWNERLSAFEARLRTFAGDPNFATVEGNLAKVRGDIEAAFAHNKLKTIEAKYAASNLPDLTRHAGPEEAAAWAAKMRRLLEVENPKDMAQIAAFASSGAIDSQRKSSLDHWIGVVAKDDVQQKIAAATQMLDAWVETGIQTAAFIEQTDATDRDQVANRLIGEGAYERYTGQLRDGLDAVAAAASFDQALARTGGPDRAAQKTRIEAALERYRQLVSLALDSVRMPPARSTDPALLTAAEQTLRNPEYGIAGGWVRMVINYDLHSNEKWAGEYHEGTVYDTVTVYHYVWDEFQVTTAEKVGDRHLMFANRLKLFHQGAPTTPTGRWILADRFQTTEILEENIGK